MLGKRKGMLAPLWQMNWLLMLVIVALAAAGVAMQYSAAGGAWEPWARPHIIRSAMGAGAFALIVILPLSFYMRMAYPIYLLCVLLLVWVEVAGAMGMGAQRWIDLGFMRVQPSEFMKLALIIGLARYFHMVRVEDMNHPMMLVMPIVMIAVPVLLILKQPNLGTATIVTFIGLSMAFMAGIRWQYFAAIIVSALVAMPVGWQFLHDYQKQRVMTFLDPSQDPLGSGYNITQSIIAIGSGGMFGKGYLHGSQGQLDFLPEKQTDFIFTMTAEEFGFIGAVGLLVLFTILLAFSLALSVRPHNRFAALLAAGVTAMLFVHIFINVGMVMGLLPVVGVPLPFMSYGGTFLLACWMACGLLMKSYLARDEVLHRNIRAL